MDCPYSVANMWRRSVQPGTPVLQDTEEGCCVQSTLLYTTSTPLSDIDLNLPSFCLSALLCLDGVSSASRKKRWRHRVRVDCTMLHIDVGYSTIVSFDTHVLSGLCHGPPCSLTASPEEGSQMQRTEWPTLPSSRLHVHFCTSTLLCVVACPAILAFCSCAVRLA